MFHGVLSWMVLFLEFDIDQVIPRGFFAPALKTVIFSAITLCVLIF